MSDVHNGMHLPQSLNECQIWLQWWRSVAIDLANAGFCEYCDAHCASEMDNCPDTDGWHSAYERVAEVVKELQ